jgi:TonB family protein
MSVAYTTFGNFLLLKQRSQDGLGTLWRAGEMERAGFKRVVWLRRFDNPSLDRAPLAAEAPHVNQVVPGFRATNVVRNSVCGTEGRTFFLAWDYQPAQPLDQVLGRVIEEQFPVPIDNALLIAEKLAAALTAALAVHYRGEAMVHGFLLPHFVLVGNDGEAGVAGIALGRALLANLDRTGVRELAAPYLAPEVLSTRAPSPAGDVYSLGAILYHLLCGHPLPADPAARGGALARPELAFAEGAVPADILQVLRRALADSPTQRFASATDFKRDLEKLLYGGAYSPTTFNLALFMDRLYRAQIEDEDREVQREKSIDVTPFLRPAREEPPAAEPLAEARRSPSRIPLFAAIGVAAALLAVVGYLLLGRRGEVQVMDANAQRQLVQQLVQEEVARKEGELLGELQKERDRLAEAERQLEEARKASAAGRQRSAADAQRQLEQQQRVVESLRQQQSQTEAQLSSLRQQRSEPAVPSAVVPAAAAVAAAAVPTAPPAIPTLAIVETPSPAAPTLAAPTQVPAAAVAPPPRENDLVDFTEVEEPPQMLHAPTPTLRIVPSQLRGVTTGAKPVILSALVNARGEVEDVKVLRGYPVPRLGIDEACAAAVRQYRFRPATKAGVKVKTWTTVTMRVNPNPR